MPQKRKSMKQIRQIIRLHLVDPTLSIRSISRATNVSRPVVSSYIELLTQYPLTIEKLNSLNDTELKSHLNLQDSNYELSKEKQQLIQWLTIHIDELQKIGVTRKLLHERYLEKYPDGLSYSRFAFTIQNRFQEKEISGLLEHKIADKLYMDYVGKKFIWKDYQNNTYTEEVFLATLGASGYLYAIPFFSQKTEAFCYCVEQAFIHLGGVPRAVVPDCLKSAVISHDGYESKPNQLFLALLKHYNCVSIPARPRHPKDKASVEGSVNLIYRQIYARNYELVFENRDAMLTWWFEELDKINEKPFQKIKGSRKSRFLEQEKEYLKPLPEHAFEMTSILQQTINSTCVVYIPQDKTRYSVPFTLIGETVDIHVYATTIEIWHDGQRKAMHTRQKEKDLVINPTHQHKNIAHVCTKKY